MGSLKALGMLIGRIMLVYIFLVSGSGKIMNFAGTAQMMAQHGIPMTHLMLMGAICFELGGSILVTLGLLTRLGCLLLLIFLVPTTMIFHGNVADPMQKIHFMKNVAILGGILFVLAAGPGRFSVDGFRGSAR